MEILITSRNHAIALSLTSQWGHPITQSLVDQLAGDIDKMTNISTLEILESFDCAKARLEAGVTYRYEPKDFPHTYKYVAMLIKQVSRINEQHPEKTISDIVTSLTHRDPLTESLLHFLMDSTPEMALRWATWVLAPGAVYGETNEGADSSRSAGEAGT